MRDDVERSDAGRRPTDSTSDRALTPPAAEPVVPADATPAGVPRDDAGGRPSPRKFDSVVSFEASPKETTPTQSTCDPMAIELSLCGHQLGHGAASDALSFAAGRVTFEQLQADPNLWFNPRLFGRLPYEALPPGEDANTLYPWKVLWPCLAAVTCFGKPLTADDVQKLRNMLSESEGMQGGETSRWPAALTPRSA